VIGAHQTSVKDACVVAHINVLRMEIFAQIFTIATVVLLPKHVLGVLPHESVMILIHKQEVIVIGVHQIVVMVVCAVARIAACQMVATAVIWIV